MKPWSQMEVQVMVNMIIWMNPASGNDLQKQASSSRQPHLSIEVDKYEHVTKDADGNTVP